jgi:hypothetical protein
MIPLISECGVTSKAGFHTPIPGAAVGTPLIVVNSTAGLSSKNKRKGEKNRGLCAYHPTFTYLC